MKLAAIACAVCVGVFAATGEEARKPAPAKSPADALKKKVEKADISGPAKEVFEKVGALADVKIEPDWTVLKAAGVKEDARITVKAGSATVEQLLEIALIRAGTKDCPLGWYVQDNVIRVNTQLFVLYRGRMPLPLAKVGEGGKEQAPAAAPPAQVREINFENLPLEDAVTFLREVSGLNIVVQWKALEAVKVDRKTPVSLKVSGVSIARVMDLVLDQLNPTGDRFDRVYWVIDGNIITISTGAALNTDTTTKVFDVGELLVVVPNFKGPKIEIQPKSSQTGSGITATGGGGIFTTDSTDKTKGEEEENMAELRKKVQENLIGAVKDSIGDEMWQPNGKGSIRILRNNMIIAQTPLGFKLLEKSGVVR